MKSQRHEKIREIIEKHNIETQEELTKYLRKEGFNVTQATVSRDIKAMRLVKIAVHDGGASGLRYKYAVNLSKDEMDTALNAKFKAILGEAVVSTDYAGNLVVMKTYAGMAQASAAAIDSMSIPNILGTIAGDDTILIIMRTEAEAEEFVRTIGRLTK